MNLDSAEIQTDLFKRLGDWSLAAGRSLQSQQTGFVHYFGEATDEPFRAIPIVENAFFVLALFRSRLVEQIQEGKGLLKKLLAFQNQEGNFPKYLHQYPDCEDASTSLQLLTAFYWILLHFSHVLGQPLKTQLEQAARLALENSLKNHEHIPFPYSLAIRLASAQYAFGRLGNRIDWVEQGKNQLENYAERQLEGWKSTSHLGDLLLGLQMVYPSMKNSSWQKLWQHMEQTWHGLTATYVGPCIKEWQEEGEPKPNLYDLFAGYFSGHFSKRATLSKPYHLYASAIQAWSDRFASSSSALGTYKEQAWKTFISGDSAYTLLEKKQPFAPSVDRTFSPLRYIWGDLQMVHSFVCQGGAYAKVEYSYREGSVDLIFDLLEFPESEIRQKREIEFFLDVQSEILFSASDKASNTFSFGEKLILSMNSKKISLVFELLEGEGDFMGHVMRGSRPSQVLSKSYDWTLFLRTIRRSPKCRIKARIQCF